MKQVKLVHPTLEQLTAFGRGELGDAEHADIEKHLAECDSCCQTLKDLPDDTIVALLREPEADTSVSPDRLPDAAREAATLPPAHSPTELSEESEPVLSQGLPSELSEHSRYDVLELLGKGGMGDVYKAHHRMMNRPVALKLINGQLVQSDAAVQRFHREVQAAARLSHPNIVTAHDAEQAGDLHYLVMEFVDGMDLAEIVRERGRLPVHEACDFIRQAAEGLQHAHELGMVHRDIKPQNLMLADDGKIKILDFGLANFATETAAEHDGETVEEQDTPRIPTHLTLMGSMMGTPDYISPEQARDAHSADIRSDIYSLGCTLYCLLTGEPPFASGSMLDKVMAHVESEPKPLSDFRDDVPAGVNDVLRRMMAKNPDDRFQTPAELVQALQPFMSAGPAAPAKHTSPSRSPFVPIAIVASVLLAFFVALGAVIVVATDRGRVVITSYVGGVQVAVMENGKQIEIIDVKTGSKVKWLPTGNYELKLIGNDNDVRIDNQTFEMRRLGTVIVTANWNSEGRGAIRSFKMSDPTITRDGIDVADGGWKITASGTRTVRLFETPMPPMRSGPYFYRAKLKSENVTGRAYLEMWSRFPGQGEFFSKGFDKAITGTNGWAEYEVPFFLKKGEQPDLVKLNLAIEGSGTVWIKDIELRGRAVLPKEQHSPDVKRLQGKWVPESCLMRGKALTAEQLARMSITLAGNRAELTDPDSGQLMTGTFSIDAGRSPKHIDFIAPDGKERAPGIFEFDGDRLKLAWNDGDYARPTDFEPAETPDHMTAVFKLVPGSVPVTVPLEETHETPVLDEVQREVLKAAETFLAELDHGRFGSARDLMSTLAKRNATREVFSNTIQPLRDAFGKVKHRTLHRVQAFDEPVPGLPQGRYAGVQFKSNYQQKDGLWESLLLCVDTDGQWRVTSYSSTLQPLPFPKQDEAERKKLDAAEAAAREWLKLVDAGQYGEAWEACAELARNADGKQKLTKAYTNLFAPLGQLQSRTLLTRNYETQMARTPKGDYAVIRFDVQFSKQRITETVVLTKEADGHWRVSGYFHAEDKSALTPPPAVPVGKNLITDPSLENTAVGERYPQGWGTGNIIPKDAYQFQVVEGGRTDKHGWMIEGDGKYAVIPTNRPPAHQAYRYAASAWVHAEAGTAQIKLLYFTGTGVYLGENRSSVTIKRDGWHRLTMIDDLAKFPAAIKLSLALTLIGKGKAVFDDIELIAFDAKKLPENFEKEYGSSAKHDPAMFDRWVGRWETTTEYKRTSATEARTVKGETVVRKILDDRFLLWQFRSEGSGPHYIAILGFDEYIDAYHIWLFGSAGEAYERIGQWDETAGMLSLDVKPPAPGITGTSTDRFVDKDHIESTLLVKDADGQVTRDIAMKWVRKSSTVSVDIDVSSGPVSGSQELALLLPMTGNWTIRQTNKPSIWFPDGETATFTERNAWAIGGRFLVFRSYDDKQHMTTLALMTYGPKEKSYHYWHFASDVFGGQWRITWDESSRGFHWRSIDMPTGWIGTGFNRWIDDDTFDNQALIKDEQGRVLLDSRQDKKRIK